MNAKVFCRAILQELLRQLTLLVSLQTKLKFDLEIVASQDLACCRDLRYLKVKCRTTKPVCITDALFTVFAKLKNEFSNIAIQRVATANARR